MIEHHHGWWTGPVARPAFQWDVDRATGYLEPTEYTPIIDALDASFGVRCTIVAFQAYRNGSGCGWHADTPFDAQAILSLGATRTFGVRALGGEAMWMNVAHGDLVYMPPGAQLLFEHCVPEEHVEGERLALVFRTPRPR